MTAATKRIGSLAILVSLTLSATLTGAGAITTTPNSGYTQISMDEVRRQAAIELNNAKLAGRLSKDEATTFASQLENANSLASVEQVWADLEAQAQVAKERHVSLDHLMSVFTAKLDQWQRKGIVNGMVAKTYRDKVAEIQGIKKQMTAKDRFFDFWEFVVLANELSALDDRLTGSLGSYQPPVETLDGLMLRSDRAIAGNEVCARKVTVYKSFEVEPDNLREAKDRLYQVLQDRAHSNVATQSVRDQLYARLYSTQYSACQELPSEAEIDKAIVEVQRLLDAGAKNGNLSATDDVRLQHELELVKEFKKAWPGSHPGIDPIEREVRTEELRFMSLDLRFLQDWLGRVLRKDGDPAESREQILRAVRRIDLACYSGRISSQDAASLLSSLITSVRTTKNDRELVAKCRLLEGRMDMMVADYSMVPAQTAVRVKELTRSIGNLNSYRDAANADKVRIEQLLVGTDNLPASKRFGISLVAAAELEILRQKVNVLLKQTES